MQKRNDAAPGVERSLAIFARHCCAPRRILSARQAAATRLVAILLSMVWVAAGCASHHPIARAPVPSPAPPAAPPAPPATAPPVAPGTYVEEGLASWYGVPFHGSRAADGEIYDMYKMTAAHRTLPFDSVVRVTNLKNGRTAEVRIIDRGPFVEHRIIDLSLAAARELDLVGPGTAPVRIEMLSGPNPLLGSFTVQVGAFQMKENADRMRARLQQRYPTVFIQEYDSPKGVFYRVRVGRAPSTLAAQQLASRLAGEENVVPFVVRLDP